MWGKMKKLEKNNQTEQGRREFLKNVERISEKQPLHVCSTEVHMANSSLYLDEIHNYEIISIFTRYK